MKVLIYTIGAILLISSMSAKLVDFSEKGWAGDCIAGKRQSPIDFPTNYNYTDGGYFRVLETVYPVIDNLTFAQQPANLKSYNLLNVNVTDGANGYLMARKDNVTYRYNLLDVHFHILAEHTFGGKAYAAEMHMVHQKDRSWLAKQGTVETAEDKVNDYLVVGTIFAVDGTTDDSNLNRMNINTGKVVNNLDFTVYSKKDMEYYHYIGGLTTPDCNQVVNWVVNSKVTKISTAQNNAIRNWITALYPNGNTRVVQPLNGRQIYKITTETIEIKKLDAGFLKGNMMMLISVMIAAFFL
jgi:carbonic anhydrase